MDALFGQAGAEPVPGESPRRDAEAQRPAVLEDEDLPPKLYGLKLPGIARSMEARFHHVGIHTTEQMYGLTVEQIRRVWGGVNGEHWWHLLRGHRVAEPPAVRRSAGHPHVLPPDLRSRWGASAVAGRLLEKAAERMRGLGYGARAISVARKGRYGVTRPAFPCAATRVA